MSSLLSKVGPFTVHPTTVPANATVRFAMTGLFSAYEARLLCLSVSALSLSLSRIIQKSSCEKSPLPTAQAQYCRFRMTWPNELGYPMQLSDRVGALIRSSLCAGFDSFKGVSL